MSDSALRSLLRSRQRWRVALTEENAKGLAEANQFIRVHVILVVNPLVGPPTVVAAVVLVIPVEVQRAQARLCSRIKCWNRIEISDRQGQCVEPALRESQANAGNFSRAFLTERIYLFGEESLVAASWVVLTTCLSSLIFGDKARPRLEAHSL